MIDPKLNIGLGEQLTDILRMRIVGGQLQNGLKLTETAIASEFGLSRAPVREAFRNLEYEGLLDITKQGAVVKVLTEKEVNEFYNVRYMLESFALSHIPSEAREQIIRFLETSVDRMELALGHKDADEFTAQDIAFHTKAFEVIDHKFIKLFWSNIDKLCRAILIVGTRRQFDKGEFEYKRQVVDKHRQIVAALKEGNNEEILDALRNHFHYNSWIDKKEF
ncbi:GntR family transcriptional regulator [Paenibacillus rhizophilus]|uniref:GntR family transcriptional regulator n=1 Tax=Paenibacillus rhizophilus TaxID=1850366 RepID=A0A3N9Q124_9BACL|nr:GntR family transcriptional regulator [Paenibacillus rhizophilus]RQW11196.1 GntR family transcriptional regulator [Paenibacillus rhizophilus]